MQRETAPQNYSVNTRTKMSIFNHESIFGLTFKFCKSLLWNINYDCVAQKQKKVKYWWHSRFTNWAVSNRAVTRGCALQCTTVNVAHARVMLKIIHVWKFVNLVCLVWKESDCVSVQIIVHVNCVSSVKCVKCVKCVHSCGYVSGTIVWSVCMGGVCITRVGAHNV